jgi:hypothetical protein
MNKSPGNKRSQIVYSHESPRGRTCDSIRFPIQTGGSFQGQYSKLLSNDNTDRKQKNLKDEFKDNDSLYDKSVKTIMTKNDGTVYHADDSCGKKRPHPHLSRTYEVFRNLLSQWTGRMQWRQLQHKPRHAK